MVSSGGFHLPVTRVVNNPEGPAHRPLGGFSRPRQEQWSGSCLGGSEVAPGLPTAGGGGAPSLHVLHGAAVMPEGGDSRYGQRPPKAERRRLQGHETHSPARLGGSAVRASPRPRASGPIPGKGRYLGCRLHPGPSRCVPFSPSLFPAHSLKTVGQSQEGTNKRTNQTTSGGPRYPRPAHFASLLSPPFPRDKILLWLRGPPLPGPWGPGPWQEGGGPSHLRLLGGS